MQLVENDEFQRLHICVDVSLPQRAEALAHQPIVEHLEVGEQYVGHSVKYGVTVLYDVVLAHRARIVFGIDALAHEESSRHLVAQPFVVPYCLSQTFGLVAGKGIHRVHDDDLHARLPFILVAVVAVVEYRVEETLRLTRTCSCGEQRWFRIVTVVHRELAESLKLMFVWWKVRGYVEWYIAAFFFCRRYKRGLQGNVWSLEQSVFLVFNKTVEGITHHLFLEAEGGLDIFYDRVAHFTRLL